jgi:hypothetical protein
MLVRVQQQFKIRPVGLVIRLKMYVIILSVLNIN